MWSNKYLALLFLSQSNVFIKLFCLQIPRLEIKILRIICSCVQQNCILVSYLSLWCRKLIITCLHLFIPWTIMLTYAISTMISNTVSLSTNVHSSMHKLPLVHMGHRWYKSAVVHYTFRPQSLHRTYSLLVCHAKNNMFGPWEHTVKYLI